MKSISAICITYVLYYSMEILAQESAPVDAPDIYVPALKSTASFAPGASYKEVVSEHGELREARKVGLLRGIWKKPRVSPLYLVNGTICRFVNSSPICTTLATTGLGINGNINGSNNLNPNNFNPNNLSQFGNNQQFLPNNNNNNNNQQFSNRNNNNNNQLYTPANLNNNNNNNQFNRQQQPQFVSSALNEEDSQEVAVQTEASGGSPDNQATETHQQTQATSKPVQSQQAAPTSRPMVVNRRPLLPLRLPLRQFSIG